jgi:hypothetical protein
MLLIYCCKYVSDTALKYITIGFAAFIPSVVMAFGFQDNEWKLSPYYTVPEGYIYTENSSGGDKIGTGFMEETVYTSILVSLDYASSLNKEESYLGVLGVYGYYYFTDLKGASTIEVEASIKGYDAAVETVELLEEKHAIVGTSFDTVYNYYFYKWLLTSGKYYYDSGLFYYNDKGYSDAEVKNKNCQANLGTENLYLAREASALGASMDSLNSIFEEVDLSIDTYVAESFTSLNFEEIAGEDADFLYLEFDGVDDEFEYVLYNQGTLEVVPQDAAGLYKYLLKKEYNPGKIVIINWLDDEGESHSERCLLSKGNLVVPLGSGSEWLLNNHNTISIVLQEDGEVVSVPEIKTAKFLKLREIN